MSSVCVQAVAGAITCAANAYFLFLYTTGRRNDDRDFQIVGAHAAAAHATIMTDGTGVSHGLIIGHAVICMF
jgi:hypothetical protein